MKQRTKIGKLVAKIGASFTIFGLLAWSLPAGLTLSLLPVGVDQEVQTVSANGNQGTATVTGTVTKPDGSSYGNSQNEVAMVELRPEGPGNSLNEDTTTGGAFTFSNVPYGQYTLTASVGSDSQYTSSRSDKVSISSSTVNVGSVKLTSPTLIGVIVDPNGTAIADSQVDVRSMDYTVNRGARTGEDGSFKMGGLDNGTYILTARAPQGSQYSDTETSVSVTDKNTAKNLGNIALSSPNVIGRIVDPSGNALVISQQGPGGGLSVNVDISNQDRTTQRNTQIDSDGYFRFGTLPTGTYTLSTNIWGSSVYTSTTDQTISVTQGTLLNVGDLRLTSPQITGTVTNPDGSEASNAWVQAHTDDWSVQKGSNANNGVYTIGGLSAGTYKVSINVPWGSSGVVAPDEQTVTITDGGAIQTLNFQFTAAVKFVRGTVTRSNGAAVTDARVEANRPGAHSEANVESDGSYELSLGAGVWEIRVNPQMGPGMPTPDWIFSGFGQSVEFANNSTVENKTINFTVQTASSRVKGKVLKPDGTPLSNGNVDVRNQEGKGNGQPLNPDGTFNVPVAAGNYRVNVWAGENSQFTFPEKNVGVKDNETIDIGTLQASAKNAHIVGKVVKSDGTPVQGMRINANLDRAPGWGQSTSQADGTFDIAVTEGRWHVNIDKGANSSYVYSGEPLDAEVEDDNSTVNLGNITLTYADITIEGKVVNSDGDVVLGVFGWVFARKTQAGDDNKGFGPMMGGEFGGPINGQTGAFSLKVPSTGASSYTIGMHLPPDTDYSVGDEQTVAVVANQTYTKNITLKRNDASISGKLQDQDGNALTSCNFRGDVFVNSKSGDWRGAEIKSDCTYSISLLGGKSYRMGYWIEQGQGFMEKPPSSDPIDVAAGQNLVKNITVTKANATITGRVVDPSGNGIRAFVFAGNWIEFENGEEEFDPEDHFEKELFSGGETDSNGNFTLNVLKGHTYEVNAGVPAEKSNYMPPDRQEVDLNTTTSANITLQLKASTGRMTGTVTLGGAPINMGFVHCWNPEGGFTGGPVMFGGAYAMNYTSGTWYCGADSFDGNNFYRSEEEGIVIGENETSKTKDFELKASTLQVPSAMSVTVDDVTQTQTLTLENGTQVSIPAGALGDSGSATVTATPTIDLTRTKNEQPFGVGYELEALDSSGSAITTFNTPVTITFTYTDEQLEEFDMEESALIGKYYDEDSNTWKSPTGIVQDTENNVVTVSTDHFTKFAVVASGAATATASATVSGSSSTHLPQHPNGTLVKAKDGSSVYVLEGGKKRPIVNPSIFEARGYKWNEIVEISRAELNSYTTGDDVALYPDGYLLAGPDGKVYVIADSTKRYITGPGVFTTLGYSWSNVINVPSAHLNLYSNGSDVSSTSTHPNGTLVKTASGSVIYLLEGGLKRPFTSPLYFEARGYKWSYVVTVTQTELDSYTTGLHINTYPSGKILMNSDSRVYVVEDSSVRYIVTPHVFEELGYKWSNVIKVSTLPYTDGGALWTVMNHPDGTLVTAGGAVYVIEDGKKRLVVSPAIFEDQGYEWDDIISVSQAELQKYQDGASANVYTDGNLLKGSDGKVYIISDGTKRYITGPAVFDGLGYKWGNVINVSDAHLALYTAGTDVSSSATRPDGDTVKKSDGNLYTVIDGALRHIPTPVYFERGGGDWNKVISISDAEFNGATKGDDLTNVLPDGALLKGSDNKVYVVVDGTKRYFSGPDIFEALGYSWSNLITTTTSDLGLYTDGSDMQ